MSSTLTRSHASFSSLSTGSSGPTSNRNGWTFQSVGPSRVYTGSIVALGSDTEIPVSSMISRRAASCGVSPSSIFPATSDQRPG